jgi:peptide/nickel transport system substrate-binding protein
MFRNTRRPRLARAALTGAAAALVVGIAACSSAAAPPGGSSASSSSSAATTAGGVATVALPPGVSPNYIFPFVPAADANEYNTLQFQELMYRPLYYFGGNSNSVAVNYPLSTADAPVYSNGGKTVTITMKGWKWSNGETVDAQDVVFWLNMMEAEKANFYGYVPGLLPDNLASYKATGPDTVVLNLKSTVSTLWFTYNQLAEITPMPAAWDVTSASATAGSGGCATDSAADKWAKCTAVYNFLSKQATDVATYDSSPIWGTVDGPWKLSVFSTTGDDDFVPNKAYSGAPKPTLAGFDYKFYTDDSTEYTALRTGQLDAGYIPAADLPQKPLTQVLPSTDPLGSGFNLQPAYSDSIDYYFVNFNNPTVGPIFKQLYIRQALQETVDQNGIATAVDRGYGYPTSGPVPNQPKSMFIPSIQSSNSGLGPYPFSPTAAKALLTSHGWTEKAGVMTCTDPSKCGAGIAQGAQLKFTMDWATGQEAFEQEVSVMKSDAAEAGIDISLVGQSFNTLIGESTPCSGSKCTWDMLNIGGWNFNGPGFEPTGEPLFQTGAGSNSGSYSNPTEDKLIQATHTSNSLSTFDQYATYTAQQVPFIWDPNAYNVWAVKSNLTGVTFNPLAAFVPEYWAFTK